MTITVELRAKVVQMHLEGHGRNQITRILSVQGLHVSEGSVGNIVRAYRKHEQSLQSDTSGIEQANPKIVTPRDGGPLSHFLDEDTSTDDEVVPSVTSYSNSPSPVVRVPTPPKPEPFSESKPRDLSIKGPDSHVLEEESELMGVLSPEGIENSKSKEADIDFSDKPAHLDFEEEAFLLDSDPKLVWRRFFKQIAREKDNRRHDMFLLERRKALLENNEKRVSHDLEQLEHRQHELEIRENIVLSAEPFLQAARQLQDMGLDISSALPWLEIVHEKAQIERLSVDVAAISVAQEIRNYRQLGGLQRQIEITQGQLKMIDITSAQKEKALSILAELQDRGISLDVINELSKYIDLRKMCRDLNPLNSISANGQNTHYPVGNGQKVGIGMGHNSRSAYIVQ